jgi:hypothetical protein
VVLVSDAVIGVADRLESDFAIVMGKRKELASGMFFWSSAFVDINMSVVAAEDRMKRPGKGLQAENISASAVKSEKNCNIGTEMLFKLPDGRPCVMVVAIGYDVAMIGTGDGFEDFGVNAGIVITGKTAAGRTGMLHKEPM